MYSRERDMKKEVAFMKVIQISDFHLRGDGKLSFQKADTMKALHQTIDYFCSMKDYELPEFFVVIQKTVIPKEDVKKIFDKIVFGIVVETELNVYMNESAAKIYQNLFLEKTKGFDEIERKRIKTENKFLYKNNIKDFDFEKEDVYKICLIDHKEKLQQFQKEVKQVCSVVQLIPFADKWMMECIPFGCDKGKAIGFLNKYFGIKTKESMAFGDGENDIKMLEAVGTGIAMKNSSQKLLETADVICDSVKQEGIYKELLQRKLIKEKK